jgi:two-component system, cell cycle response regulator DivK
MVVRVRAVRERPLILVAEDYSDARELLQECLQLEGFDVVVASNGEEAVRRARVELPDAVVMDLSMPVLDGYDATRQLKQDVRTREIPVVAHSGHLMPRHTEQARLAGCETIVPKPCRPSAMAARIRALLHTSRAKP